MEIVNDSPDFTEKTMYELNKKGIEKNLYVNAIIGFGVPLPLYTGEVDKYTELINHDSDCNWSEEKLRAMSKTELINMYDFITNL